MSKLSERWFCSSGGGHWVDSGSELLGRDFCSEHDSRVGAMLGRIVLGIVFILILLLLVNGFWIIMVGKPYEFCITYGC